MIIFVDIDETICHLEEHLDYDYSKSTPIQHHIDKINKLYDEGHTIIYWTARGAVTGIFWYRETERQLKKWKCKYHELRMGKPNYDILICDKSKRIEEI